MVVVLVISTIDDVLSDKCFPQFFTYFLCFRYAQEKNGQWGRAVIEIRGKKARAQRVPIMDIGFLDNGADAEFGVKVGRACFS